MSRMAQMKIPGEIFHSRTFPRWMKYDSVIEQLIGARDEKPEGCVFVSYAHEDCSVVLPWVESLLNEGLNVGYDCGGLHHGSWFEELAQSIDHSAGMVFVMSPRSVASKNCHRELQYALQAGKPVAFAQLYVLDE